ncbi:MAG: hypothetical protein ACLPID_18015 [Beijerinckiaceae bacterium]
MNYRDPRLAKSVWIFALAVTALNLGMAFEKLDNGSATPATLGSLIFGAIAFGGFLFILIRDVWKT